jgi:aminopeptidase C
MTVYGWNEIGWKVQNSWGEKWGDGGCVIIPYDFQLIECWTLTDTVIEGTIIRKPFSSKIGKKIAKAINNIHDFTHPSKKK